VLTHNEAMELMRSRLTQERYEHSLGVAQTARELAECYQVDGDKAYQAGILHDYAKSLSGEELLAIAETMPGLADEMEKQIPAVLHAPVGAYLLAREQHIEDQELLEAVKSHTLGSMGMGTLAKIIFLADMIEPGRRVYPALARIRQLARQDLNQAMLAGLEANIRYCRDKKKRLHPRTVEVRNEYLRIVGKMDG